MSRLIPLLFLIAIPLVAQEPFHSYDSWEGRVMDHQPQRTADEPWIADLTPNRRYPITVRLNPEGLGYDGVSYTGEGTGHVFNPRGEDIAFHYSCGVSFEASEFYARSNKTGTKFTIHLRKPGTNHTTACTIHTTFVASNSPPHGLP